MTDHAAALGALVDAMEAYFADMRPATFDAMEEAYKSARDTLRSEYGKCADSARVIST